MATGTEMYNAVRQATTGRIGMDFAIHPVDASDLNKLVPADLQTLGYDLSVAENVSEALYKSDYGPLERILSIHFVFDHDAPRLASDKRDDHRPKQKCENDKSESSTKPD